ncbi:MAG: diacylglycerol/lipid kinase family protein [Acidimicrobiia bacterium]
MTSPFGKAFVIANPLSGRGKVGRDPSWLEGLLREKNLEYELRLTEKRRHATDLARQALREGYRFIVAAGGDGTIHEVVNGMMSDNGPLNPEAVLGVLATGSGSDFIRTFGLPQDPVKGVGHLIGENLFEIDVGKITYTDSSGAMHSEFFPNIAEAGFGGDVVKHAEKLPRWVGGLRYMLGFWMTLLSSRITKAKVVMDNRTYQGPLTNLVVANAQFYGRGMHIAPKAHPADGIFDVLVQAGNKRDYVIGLRKVYKGEHLQMKAVKLFHARRVEVDADLPLQIEGDGEVLGFTPATFEIVENALRLKI